MELLKVKDLKTYFYINKTVVPAVDGVSFDIKKGEIVALVGESGSGKSVTSRSIMGLIKEPGKIVEGEIIFQGKDLLKLRKETMRKIQGNKIAMVYQEPMSCLNPLMKVGDQIAEALIIHRKADRRQARHRAVEMMRDIGIPDAQERYYDLPSKFSGGMRQRIMIAMAIVCNPDLLIADEPTTALDVTIQAEMLDIIKGLRESHNMSVLLITHDLGVVAHMADKVCVMYCGKIMEQTSKEQLYKNPMHPYTKGLIRCIPKIDETKEILDTIEGYVPHPSDFPKGCRFSTRCPQVMPKCKETMPELLEIETNHFVRCWLHENK
jgi:oligopeptide/dipeptide ABC transporter ATP-binding protein